MARDRLDHWNYLVHRLIEPKDPVYVCYEHFKEVKAAVDDPWYLTLFLLAVVSSPILIYLESFCFALKVAGVHPCLGAPSWAVVLLLIRAVCSKWEVRGKLFSCHIMVVMLWPVLPLFFLWNYRALESGRRLKVVSSVMES